MGLKHFAIALTIAMPIAAFGQVDIKRSDIQGDISRAVLMHNNCNYVGALHLLSQIDANKASAGQVEQAKYYTALSRYELN